MGYFTMRLQDAITETHKRIPDTLEQFSELIDPEWIQQVNRPDFIGECIA